MRRLAGVPPMAILILLIVTAYGDILFAGRGLFLNDLTSYHYPMKFTVREIVRAGEFPYWNRSVSGGQPLAANPAYEVFYPPQWLTMLPSFHYGFQLHLLLHLAIAATGTFVLIESLGASPLAATFGAIAFVFGGPYLSLANKLPLLFSMSWMPWSLYFGRRCIVQRSTASFVGAAACLGAQMLIGEPTILMQTLALLGGYALLQSGRIAALGLVALISVGGASLAAVQLIPAVDFARDTVRAKPFTFQVVSNWSTPPARMAELLFPRFFDHVRNDEGRPAIASMYPFRIEPFLTSFYLGISVAILTAAGLLVGMRGSIALLLVVGISGLIAIGEHAPLLRLLYDVGVFRAVRYPEKFVLTCALAVVVWSALVLDRLLAGDSKLATTVSIIAISSTVAALIVWVAQPHVDSRSYLAITSIRAIAALILLPRAGRNRRWATVAVAASAIDVWSATRDVVPRMPRRYFDPPPLAQQFRGDPHGGRIFPDASWEWWDQSGTSYQYFGNRTVEQYWWLFRNGGFPNLPSYWNRELAIENDVDLTSLRTTDDFREAMKRARATHIPDADEAFLRMSNVHDRLRFRPVTEDLERSIQTDVERVQAVDVIATSPYPRYAFADDLQRISDVADFRQKVIANKGPGNVAYVEFDPFHPAAGRVLRASETDNDVHLEVESAGQAFLVLSITGHKYWKASIDGSETRLQPANLAFQGLIIPKGRHTVQLRYRNPLIAVGAAGSAAALLMAAFALWSRREK